MKTLVVATAALAMLGTSALAGGPVLIQEEAAPVVVTELNSSSSSSGWLLPVLAVGVLCAVACGGNGT